jgi:hypothetical protein
MPIPVSAGVVVGRQTPGELGSSGPSQKWMPPSVPGSHCAGRKQNGVGKSAPDWNMVPSFVHTLTPGPPGEWQSASVLHALPVVPSYWPPASSGKTPELLPLPELLPSSPELLPLPLPELPTIPELLVLLEPLPELLPAIPELLVLPEPLPPPEPLSLPAPVSWTRPPQAMATPVATRRNDRTTCLMQACPYASKAGAHAPPACIVFARPPSGRHRFVVAWKARSGLTPRRS